MNSEAENLLTVEPPSEYDFDNWDDFCLTALRYHKTTRPSDQRVIDRIETFRKFMSPRVVKHLGGHVLPHPRFNTTQGWDRWVSNVMEKLRGRDKSIGHAGTVDGWIAQFKARKATEREFWQGLDRLVVMDEISSEDQRNLFWNTISWEAQQRLVERSPYFDPKNEVWTSEEPGSVADAEQKLSQIMESSRVDEQIQECQHKLKRNGLLTTLSAIISCALLITSLHSRSASYMSNFQIFCFLSAIPVGFYGLAFPLRYFILAWLELRKSQREQQELRSMETV